VPAQRASDRAYLAVRGVRDLSLGIHLVTAVVVLLRAALLFAVSMTYSKVRGGLGAGLVSGPTARRKEVNVFSSG
jgi:hypothetical protein